MEFRGYLDHIRSDGDLIAAMAPRGLDLPVPVCPPWDVREVVAHLATVYDHKVMAMRLARRPEQGEWTTDEPFGKDTVEWFSDEHAKLLAELASHAPKDFAWSWWEPDQTVGFWYRRMALETVVHRVDVETQFGAPSAIDPALAVGGIDEVLTIMLAGDEEASAFGCRHRGRRAARRRRCLVRGPRGLTHPGHARPENVAERGALRRSIRDVPVPVGTGVNRRGHASRR